MRSCIEAASSALSGGLALGDVQLRAKAVERDGEDSEFEAGGEEGARATLSDDDMQELLAITSHPPNATSDAVPPISALRSQARFCT